MSPDTYFFIGGILGLVCWTALVRYVVIADHPFNYKADWSARAFMAFCGIGLFSVAIFAWPALLLSAPAFAIRYRKKGGFS